MHYVLRIDHPNIPSTIALVFVQKTSTENTLKDIENLREQKMLLLSATYLGTVSKKLVEPPSMDQVILQEEKSSEKNGKHLNVSNYSLSKS